MGLDGKKEINAEELAEALSKGAEIAYRAVMKPVEGTILTVIRESTEETKQYVKPGMDIEDVFAFFVKRAEVSLDHTPELLPVLKEVGVVDSGGAGLVLILSGFLAGLHGEEIKPVDMNHGEESSKENLANLDVEEQGFGYCTEFILRLDPKKRKSFTEDRLKTELSKLPGESIVVVQDDDIVKVHVHTLKPGNALNLGQRFGEFIKLKIENMQEQHNHIIEKEAAKPVERPRKEVAVISVAAGDGVRDMFMELHCDEVVNGGQTMNPSTEDIVAAIREVNANNVVILPNNSNIVMTAQQAAVVLEDEINVIVIPSKSIPQGLSACIMFNPEVDLEENINEMKKQSRMSRPDRLLSLLRIRISMVWKSMLTIIWPWSKRNIVACIPDKVDACKAVLKGLVDEDSEL